MGGVPYVARNAPLSKRVRFSESTASVLLDAIRGIAAIIVLLEHWRNAFFVDFSEIHGNRVVVGAVYLLCGAGHQAVVIFFVLSGYLISGSVFRAFQRNEWTWKQYLTHRLVRLWIVLLPALLLGACWDQLGMHSHQAVSLYSGANYNHMMPDIRNALSLRVFLGNVAFLQTIIVPAFGSNGALWSLANEFWYYMLFALAACIVGRIYKKPVQIVIGVLIWCSLAVFVTKHILLLFPVWLLGTLLHAVPRRPTSLWLRSVAFIAYTLVFFGIAILDRRGWSEQGVISDWILGIATFGFLWVLLGAVQQAGHSMFCRLSRSAARFSFTLYVAHTPILIFLVAIMVHNVRWIPTARSGVMAIGALAVVVGYAWLLATATEFKTDQVRDWVEGKLRPVCEVET